RRKARHHHVEAVCAGHPAHRVPDGRAQVGHDALADAARELGGEGGDQERRATVRAHEARFADGADRDDLAYVGLPLRDGLQRVEHSLEALVGPAHGAVDHDGDVIGEGAGEGLLEEVGGAGRLGGFVAPAPQCEHMLDAAGGVRVRRPAPRAPSADDTAAAAHRPGPLSETTAVQAARLPAPAPPGASVAPSNLSYAELLARSEMRRRIRASAGLTYLNE